MFAGKEKNISELAEKERRKQTTRKSQTYVRRYWVRQANFLFYLNIFI
jgi:hypothetical protein